MEHEMKLERQVRKGIDAAMRAGRAAARIEEDCIADHAAGAVDYTISPKREKAAAMFRKADYIRDLVCTMVNEAIAGRPQPWSYYEPRIAEEFGD